MSSTTASFTDEVRPVDRVKVLFEELAELSGQRNAIDGRVVEIVAEMDRDELCGMTGRAAGEPLDPGAGGLDGKTEASPNCPTWCWSARITTGFIIAAVSPSPGPLTVSWSPTVKDDHCTRHRWPDHPPQPHR
jgi:hypothetical protein